MQYNKVFVIGWGKIAWECITIINTYTDKIACIEHEKTSFSFLKSICKKNNIEYKLIESKIELTQYFLSIEERILIISANNNYIFPRKILEKSNIKVINFHNALLPKHPGRNAATWAIFHMEESTGVTWHEVDSRIDTGNIIIQKSIPIDEEITALQLTKQCMNLGVEAFKEIIVSVLNDDHQSIPQELKNPNNLHYYDDIPNKGILDTSWSISRISAFLRSMDYGKFEIFPSPRIKLLGNKYSIVKYKIGRLEKWEKARVMFEDKIGIFIDEKRFIQVELNLQ